MAAPLLFAALVAGTAHAGPTLTAGYHGDFASHPGGYVGMSTNVATAGAVTASLGADLGTYHHTRNHTGAFLRGHLATRVTSTGGWLVEPRFSVGYLHTWVAGDQFWMVDPRTGALRPKSPAGTANATYGLGLGLGHTLKSGPTLVVRPEIFGRAPFNDYTLSQFAVQAGIEFPIGGAR